MLKIKVTSSSTTAATMTITIIARTMLFTNKRR